MPRRAVSTQRDRTSRRGPAGPGAARTCVRAAATGGDPPAVLPVAPRTRVGCCSWSDSTAPSRTNPWREAGSSVYSSNLAGGTPSGSVPWGTSSRVAVRQFDLSAPWSLLFVDGAPLTLCTGSRDRVVVPEGRQPEHVATGETVIVRGPAPSASSTRSEPSRADRVRRALRDARAGRNPPPARLERLRPLMPGRATTRASAPTRYGARSAGGCWTRCPTSCASHPTARPTPSGPPGRRGRRRRPGSAGSCSIDCWTGCWCARCASGSTGPAASRRPGTRAPRSGGRPRPAAAARRAGGRRGRSPRWPTGPGCRAPRWRSGSPTWSAIRL